MVRAADGPDAGRRAPAHYGWFNYWRRPHESIAYRGTLEFDFLVIAAADPNVVDIRRPGKPIRYWAGGSWRLFRPRFDVRFRTEARERWCSFAVLIADDAAERAATLRRVERDARAVGRDFTWLTHLQIRAEPRLTNAKLILAQAGARQIPLEDLNAVRAFARERRRFTLAEIVGATSLDYARAYRAALNLAARGELAVAHDRYFDAASPLTWRTQR